MEEGSASTRPDPPAGRRAAPTFGALSILCALGALIVAAIAVVGHSAPDGSKRSRLKHLYQAALATSEENLAGLNSYTFLVPKIVIPFRKGFTVGELTDVLKHHMGGGSENLTDRYSFIDFIAFLATTFAISPESPFAAVSINTKLEPGTLAIWVVDPTKLADRGQLGGTTCAYLGYADVIICNALIVRQALEDIEKINRSQSLALNYCDGECPNSFRMDLLGNTDDLHSLLQQNFLVWLIGHEIGHAIRHRDWALQSQQPLHFLGRYDPREAEADHFVGEVVDRAPALKASFAPLLLEYVDQRFLSLYRARAGALEMVIPAQNQPEAPLRLEPDPQANLLARSLGMITTILARDPDALGQIYLRPIGNNLGFVNSIKNREYVSFLNSKVMATGLWGSSATAVKWYVMLLMVVSAAVCILVLAWGKGRS